MRFYRNILSRAKLYQAVDHLVSGGQNYDITSGILEAYR